MNSKSLIVFIFLAVVFLQTKLTAQENINFVDTLQAEIYRDADLDTVYRQFKNTSVKLKTPKYFVEFESDEVSGFMNTGTAASIVGFEYDNTPYVGFYDAYADKISADVGEASFMGSEETKTLSGKPGKFYFYSFFLKETEIYRIIFFTGDEKQMVFLQANYPAAFDGLLTQVIIQSFLTVEYN